MPSFKHLHRSPLSGSLLKLYLDKISFSTAAALRASKQFQHFRSLRIIGLERRETRSEMHLEEEIKRQWCCSFMYNIHAIPQLSRVLVIGADINLRDFHLILLHRLFSKERNHGNLIDRILLGNVSQKATIQRVLGPACRATKPVLFFFYYRRSLQKLFNEDELRFLRLSSVAGDFEDTIPLWDRLWGSSKPKFC